jgi:hypothetical protein
VTAADVLDLSASRPVAGLDVGFSDFASTAASSKFGKLAVRSPWDLVTGSSRLDIAAAEGLV